MSNGLSLLSRSEFGPTSNNSSKVETHSLLQLFLFNFLFGFPSLQKHSSHFSSKREPSRKGPDPTLCLGRSYPDPNQKVTTASAIVPMGPIVPNGIAATDFEYNKYAIFDPNQVSKKKDERWRQRSLLAL
jgi:hypothetical protein